MRALGEPDAFPTGDLVLRRVAGNLTARELERRSQAWRPWRAYAVMLLWRTASQQTRECGWSAKASAERAGGGMEFQPERRPSSSGWPRRWRARDSRCSRSPRGRLRQRRQAASSRSAPTISSRERGQRFHDRFVREALPMLQRWKVDVVVVRALAHDADSYFLMRAYPTSPSARGARTRSTAATNGRTASAMPCLRISRATRRSS